jgi:hypothetical protein
VKGLLLKIINPPSCIFNKIQINFVFNTKALTVKIKKKYNRIEKVKKNLKITKQYKGKMTPKIFIFLFFGQQKKKNKK